MNSAQLLIQRLDKKLEAVYDNPRHLREASNCVFASAMREGINLASFLNDVESKTAFDLDRFTEATSGNFLDFIKPEYRVMAQPLIDITAGGNGGMASIGRGEFAISFLSDFKVLVTKAGNGDLRYPQRNEECKHNGGKLAIEDKAGNEIQRTFKILVEGKNIALLKKNYLPVRKTDSSLYSSDQKKRLNGLYWQAMTGESADPMSDEQWKIQSLKRAFRRLWQKVDSLFIMKENNDFVRFFTAQAAFEFYSSRLNNIEFELRADQANAPSFYVGKQEI